MFALICLRVALHLLSKSINSCLLLDVFEFSHNDVFQFENACKLSAGSRKQNRIEVARTGRLTCVLAGGDPAGAARTAARTRVCRASGRRSRRPVQTTSCGARS